jgi:hypothetical protein
VADRETERLILGQDVPLGAGEVAHRGDALAAIGRARATDAERAASLTAMGVVTHTRFDAAGEAAT